MNRVIMDLNIFETLVDYSGVYIFIVHFAPMHFIYMN